LLRSQQPVPVHPPVDISTQITTITVPNLPRVESEQRRAQTRDILCALGTVISQYLAHKDITVPNLPRGWSAQSRAQTQAKERDIRQPPKEQKHVRSYEVLPCSRAQTQDSRVSDSRQKKKITTISVPNLARYPTAAKKKKCVCARLFRLRLRSERARYPTAAKKKNYYDYSTSFTTRLERTKTSANASESVISDSRVSIRQHASAYVVC
jgi:hypothetical protein